MFFISFPSDTEIDNTIVAWTEGRNEPYFHPV